MNCIRESHSLFSNGFLKPLKSGEPGMKSFPISTSSASSPKLSVLFVEVGILLFTLLILFATKFKQASRKTKRLLEESKGKSERRLPVVSYFPVKLPNLINGFYTLYRLNKDGTQFIDELHSKWGNLFELPMGDGTAIVVADPFTAQKILSSSNPLHLNKAKQVYDIIFPPAFQDGLVVSEYELWTKHRKVLNRSFTYKSLQTYLPFMNEHGKTLVNKLSSMCSTNREGGSVHSKDYRDLLWSQTIKIILQTIMGSDGCCSDEESVMIHDSFHRGRLILQHRFLHPYLLIGPIWWFHPMRRELDNVTASLSGIANKLIEKYRQKWKPENPENSEDDDGESNGLGVRTFRCMIEEMLCAGASDKEIFDEMGTFVSTGHETTTLAIELLMFHLAYNPECQALCREEIDNLLDSQVILDPNYNLTMDDLHNLKYFDRCVLEGLRLTTTTPVFFRRLDSPLKIDGSLTLDKGKPILFCPWAIHRDPNNFPNPEKFDPDRFLPENVKDRHAYSFMPFSGGPRNCIGYKFAIMEIKVIVGWILRNFEILTTDKPLDIKYLIELTLKPEKNINIILRKRKSLE